MRGLLTALRWITATAVIAMLLLLAWQCIDIYTDGNMPVNRDAQGVRLISAFQWEDVAARLHGLTAPLVICGMICAVTVILHLICSTDAPTAYASKRRTSIAQRVYYEAQPAGSRLIQLRTAILVIAIIFIVLGVMNGGLRDVLVKAINICTECIGLG